MIPMTCPTPIRFRVGQTLQIVHLDDGSPFADQAACLELALQERDFARSVAANSILAAGKGTFAMEHVEVLGIKVEAGDRIAIAHVRGCIRVRRQTSARPDADSLSQAAADHEFEFGSELPVFPQINRWGHSSREAGFALRSLLTRRRSTRKARARASVRRPASKRREIPVDAGAELFVRHQAAPVRGPCVKPVREALERPLDVPVEDLFEVRHVPSAERG